MIKFMFKQLLLNLLMINCYFCNKELKTKSAYISHLKASKFMYRKL